MEIQPALQPFASAECEYCKTQVNDVDAFCQQCGFPVQGTEEERNQFHYRIGYKQIQLNEKHDGIRKGRNSLYWVAGVFTVYSIVFYFMNESSQEMPAVVTTNLVLAAIFLLLGLWSVHKPVAALVSGLSLYVAVQLLNFIVEPVTLFQGVIMKVFIIIYLVRALQSAFEAKKITRALKVK